MSAFLDRYTFSYTNENKCHTFDDFIGINVKSLAKTIAEMTDMCYNAFENGGVTICFTEK